jgi:hypothetical protein
MNRFEILKKDPSPVSSKSRIFKVESYDPATKYNNFLYHYIIPAAQGLSRQMDKEIGDYFIGDHKNVRL